MKTHGTRRPFLGLLLGGLLATGLAGRAVQAQAPAQEPKPVAPASVAVWDFEHHAVDAAQAPALAHVSRALSELLIEQLLGAVGLRVLERGQLRAILDEQKIGASELVDEDARLRLGRLAGAQHMVFGNLLQIGTLARIDVRLVSVASTQVLAAQEISGSVQDLGAGLPDLAAALAASLGSTLAARTGGQSHVASSATLARFDAALALMDQKDYGAALQALQALLQTDPDFAPAARHIPIALEKLARQ